MFTSNKGELLFTKVNFNKAVPGSPHSKEFRFITMSEETKKDIDYEQAQLAYSIIESLIEHTSVVNDLIAMMAQVLDEDTTKALTQTPTWTAYLDSKRSMEKTREDVAKFAEILKQLKPE